MSDNEQPGPEETPSSQPPSYGGQPTPPGQPQYGQPPPQQYGQPPYGQQQYGQPQWGQQQPGYGGYPMQRGTNGFAIASLICAFFCWPLGLIFGFIARSQIKRTGEGGGGLALAGLIISGLAAVVLIIILIIGAVSGSTCVGTQGYCNGFNG